VLVTVFALAPNLVRACENLGLCYEAEQQIEENEMAKFRKISEARHSPGQ